MTEEIISGILREIQLMHQKNKMQLLPFILQVWKVIEVIEEEGLREEEEDLIEDMDLAEEKEEEQNMVPDTMKGDIAWCARNKDTLTYFTAPSYQNIFPEVLTSNLFLKNYVDSASQLLMTSRIVLITTQGTTMAGYASRAR